MNEINKSQESKCLDHQPDDKHCSSYELNHLKLEQLVIIANTYGISTIAKHHDLYERIRDYLITHPHNCKILVPKIFERRNRHYNTLKLLLKNCRIKNLDCLLILSTEQLKFLITIIQLHDGTVNLKNILKSIKNDTEKINILIEHLSAKLSKYIEKKTSHLLEIDSKESKKIFYCIMNIFNEKKIKIPKTLVYLSKKCGQILRSPTH